MKRRTIILLLLAILGTWANEPWAEIVRVTNNADMTYEHATSSDGVMDINRYALKDWSSEPSCEDSCMFGTIMCECYDSILLSTLQVQDHSCLGTECVLSSWGYSELVLSGNHSTVASQGSGVDEMEYYDVISSNLDFSSRRFLHSFSCGYFDCPESPSFFKGDISYIGDKIIWEEENYDVFIVNSNGTGKVFLTTGPDSDLYPNMDDNASRAVFERNGTQICSILTDGTGLNCFTSGTIPVLSNDGNYIFYRNSGNNFLYRANFDGTGIIQVFPYTFSSLSVSYDGSKVAVISRANPLGTNPGGTGEVFRMNGNGTGLEQISNPSGSGTSQVYISAGGLSITWIDLSDHQVYLFTGNLSPSLTDILPNWAHPAETGKIVTIIGLYTHFQPGVSSVAFSGGYISVTAVNVLADNLIEATIDVSPAAPLGAQYDVTVTTGTEVVLKSPAISIAPVGIPLLSTPVLLLFSAVMGLVLLLYVRKMKYLPS